MTYRPESAQEEHDSEQADLQMYRKLAAEQPEKYSHLVEQLAELDKPQPDLKVVK